VIAEIAKELGILTVAVVTKPYAFEPPKRTLMAERGLQELRNLVDSLIVIPNEKLQLVLPEDMTVVECHRKADEVLKNAVQGISGIITSPGEISVDFADVRTVMSNRGMAMMGIGHASGEGRAQKAVEMALSSPLLDDIELSSARGLLVNVTCDESLEMEEWEYINNRVNEIASEEADAKFGMAYNPESNGEIWVTVVATGLRAPGEKSKELHPTASPKVTPISKPELMPMRASASATPNVEVPTYIRNSQPRAAAAGGGSAFPLAVDDDILNIPAFLRHQAD
jgi:cell division protein FtsZ